MSRQKLVENALDEATKQEVLAMLIEEGYGTYARRLKEFKFLVKDMHLGEPIEVAAMFPNTGDIVINPCFLVDAPDGKIFKQVSTIVRHELLHFLLVHEMRFKEHLEATDPDFEKDYRRASIHRLANIAMDWDLSREGYDDHDKEVAKNLTLNGQVLGGLVLEEDRPEWLDKSMEEMFDLLKQEHDKYVEEAQKAKKEQEKQKSEIEVNVHKASHSPEYVQMYNGVIQKYNNTAYTDADLDDLINRLNNGEDIVL